ncbi:MAG: aminopeptidase P family protein [Verrucomicrobia bacterium]|nr:aminopeptidase P family protein [Verrucomicrobiota bacterium]
MIRIEKSEFEQRVARIQDAMEREGLDALLVYGDEYRKENLRYVCNFWPIFERAACVVPRRGLPVLAGGAEGERYAREMCVWDDIRVVKEFACVSVAEDIDFPLAKFTPLANVLREAMGGGTRLGLVGVTDIPGPIMDRIKAGAAGMEIRPADTILNELRVVKTEAEIACLREAGRLACLGYEKLMAACVPGNTELHATGAAEGAARQAGAEDINFTVMGTGPRTATVIGRPINRIIEDGDMVMASFAVQYEGYVATAEFPFVAGKASGEQKRFLDALFAAANEQLKHLRAGVIAGDMVRAVRTVFRKRKLDQYDIYPPMHGIGLAEAELPYPDEKATYPLRAGMCVNSDISLFGHPAGSNRIEEGFVITADGTESLTPLIRTLCAKVSAV